MEAYTDIFISLSVLESGHTEKYDVTKMCNLSVRSFGVLLILLFGPSSLVDAVENVCDLTDDGRGNEKPT